MAAPPFIPAHFAPPPPPRGPGFVLTPLLVSHNERDLKAWSSSVEHIRATPGFATYPWPNEPMTLERNERDLAAHEDDFAQRVGFTYTVLDDEDGDVIGCVYIYPSATAGCDADVRSWVRSSRADMDAALYAVVIDWLGAAWPFATFDYAGRPGVEDTQAGEEPPATS